MTIDLNWLSLAANMKSVQGFKVWGNYDIGFNIPNGTTDLTNQVTGNIEQFQITLNALGAGSSSGKYSFGLSGNIVMGDNISGDNGPPETNVYSICKNTYAPDTVYSYGDENYSDSVIYEQIESNNVLVTNLNDQLEEYENNQAEISDNISQNHDEIADSLSNILGSLPDNPDVTGFNEDDFSVPDTVVDESIEEPEFSIEKLIEMINNVSVFLPPDQKIKAQQLVSIVNSIDPEDQRAIFDNFSDIETLVKRLAKNKVDKLVKNIEAKITAQTVKVNNKIRAKVDTVMNKFNYKIDSIVSVSIDLAVNQLIQTTQNQYVDVEPILDTIGVIIKTSTIKGISESINGAVENNFTTPITSFIYHQISDSIKFFIRSSIDSIAYQIIDNGTEANINIDVGPALTSIGKNIFTGVSNVRLDKTFSKAYNDAIVDLPANIMDNLESGIEAHLDIYFTTLADSGLNKLTELIGINDNLLASSLLSNVDLNFDNLGQKIKDGDLSGIIVFDPTHIKIQTKVADFEGMVDFIKDDSIWGNSFQANVNAKIKKPTVFGAQAKYINGKVNDNSFWFLQLGVSGANIPMTPLPLSMSAVNGRVFHHMKFDQNNYIPDNNTEFGAALQMYFFNTPGNGEIIRFDVTAELAILTNGFTMELRGNSDIINCDKKHFTFVNGTGNMYYSSIDKHFCANFDVNANTAPLLCAGGNLNMNISPNEWNISLGTRESPIYVSPLCLSSLKQQGWFDINQTSLSLGIKINQTISVTCPKWIGVAAFKVKPYANAGFSFETIADVVWDPSFAVQKAMVDIDIYAGIGAHWKTHINSGTWNLAAARLHGNVEFSTVPDTYLKGLLEGNITIISIPVNFNLKVDHTFH